MRLFGFGLPLLAVPALGEGFSDDQPVYAVFGILVLLPVFFVGVASFPRAEAAWPRYAWYPGACWTAAGILALLFPRELYLGHLASDSIGGKAISPQTGYLVGAGVLLLGVFVLGVYRHFLLRRS
ncbi:hypothetical protein SAMN05421630_1011128 [Prauserella marina]|uniref:Uncharacterized protein n=2 Tax=Prauserella marina TaxID=530584 RepID=A0A1G6KBS2_9PSEU|nr:hypothetical protein DES30_101209 [Prauserella marina]SDC28377.1 hypothetical protein SAMN05421630_1011128 [Prauserella marina]